MGKTKVAGEQPAWLLLKSKTDALSKQFKTTGARVGVGGRGVQMSWQSEPNRHRDWT